MASEIMWVTKITVFLVCAPDAQELELHEVPGLGVQRGERLIHQQDARIHRQSAGQVDSLLHPAGKLVGIVVFEAGETYQFEIFLGDAQGFLRVIRCPSKPSRTFFKLVRQGSREAP